MDNEGERWEGDWNLIHYFDINGGNANNESNYNVGDVLGGPGERGD